MEVRCILQSLDYDQLPPEDQELLVKAHEAASKAFAPCFVLLVSSINTLSALFVNHLSIMLSSI